ncbi:MAG: putative manganese-dependent inorganic diphosphatase [Verrucomicrobiota bacterium]
MSIYVIGHKNPDTDAICSAIGYAEFLRKKGTAAEAARCGEINARTEFALQEAGLPHPKLIMDVRPTAEQICQKDVILSHDNESLLEAFNRMREKSLRSLPVVNDDNELVGMLSLLKIVDSLLPEEGGMAARKVRSCLNRVSKAVDGTVQHIVEGDEESEFVVTVGAMSADAFAERLKQFPAEKVVLVTGNRPTIQRPAIEYGVRCLIVSGSYPLDDALLSAARENGVSVIISPHDTASTTVLMKSANRVTHALLDKTIQFYGNDPIEGVRDRISHTSQALFPVLDGKDRLLGVFSKSDLLSPPLTQVVLVDHNEFSQAVGGIEQASILEVIDHHRLGGALSTKEPIRFINEPLGSTCTIVARMFRDQTIPLDPKVALCLATGLISDTLTLTSPTTTDVDREILPWLCQLAGKDLQAYSDAFFSAGSVLRIQTADEAVRGDCKEYEEGDWKLAIAQIEELGLTRFWERRQELQGALDSMRKERGLDFACLFVTDIGLHYSVLLASGNTNLCQTIDYPKLKDGVYELEGVVSRKKQLLPYLTHLFSQVHRS